MYGQVKSDLEICEYRRIRADKMVPAATEPAFKLTCKKTTGMSA